MTPVLRERLIGFVLLAFASAWSGYVYMTIPGGYGEGDVGPRAFPLFLGLCLMGLSLFMIALTFRAPKEEPVDALDVQRPIDRFEVGMVLQVTGLIIAYGFLMEKIGFILSTPVVIAVGLWFMLGVRKILFVVAFSLLFTFGAYLVFGKILGAYLPPGAWIGINL